ncbi:hypothetical protein, partial [Acinetobacter sp.]|uniref:hypothetical protein n=1 Tax=Acinetobacter sp. TaxID=472 RepID=UPI0025C3F0D5
TSIVFKEDYVRIPLRIVLRYDQNKVSEEGTLSEFFPYFKGKYQKNFPQFKGMSGLDTIMALIDSFL